MPAAEECRGRQETGGFFFIRSILKINKVYRGKKTIVVIIIALFGEKVADRCDNVVAACDNHCAFGGEKLPIVAIVLPPAGVAMRFFEIKLT
ncbi:MAG: hypothetical protein FWD31_03310 [Planctomycetaceae bacterium]|nr:hypothetical protein [Planctomycetaceae bacterium]